MDWADKQQKMMALSAALDETIRTTKDAALYCFADALDGNMDFWQRELAQKAITFSHNCRRQKYIVDNVLHGRPSPMAEAAEHKRLRAVEDEKNR